jgi:hypothetical protein
MLTDKQHRCSDSEDVDSDDSCYDEESGDDDYSSDEEEYDLNYVISQMLIGDYKPFLDAKISQVSKRAMKGLEYALPTSLSSLKSSTNTESSQSTRQNRKAEVASKDNSSEKVRRQDPGNHTNQDIWQDRNDESDDNDDNRFPISRSKVSDDQLGSKRYACPFYKRDKITYGSWRGCTGGWSTVARVK